METELTLNIFDLIEICTIVATAIFFYYRIDKRLVIQEVRMAKMDDEMKRVDNGVNTRLEKIDHKIDNLIESVAKLEAKAEANVK